METIRQAHQVRALAKYKSFRKAAEHLNISQSSLSQAIARLEDMYGVPLFIRNKSGVALTSYGELVLKNAGRAIDLLEETKRELRLMQNFETGRLIIGCESHLTDAYVAPPLATMVAKYPNLRYTIESGMWEELEQKLQDRQIDIFFGLKPDTSTSTYQVEEIRIPPSLIYCRTGHPLLETKDPIKLTAAQNFPFIAPIIPQSLTRAIQGKQSETTIFSETPGESIFFVSNDAAANKHVVMNSDALSAHYYNAIDAEILAGKLAILPSDRTVEFDPFDAVIITEANRIPSPGMEEFKTTLKEHIETFRRAEEKRRGIKLN